MKDTCDKGFTLIELLTVIAIIAILAAMIGVAAPRVIERAKLASLQNTCNQFRIALVGYLTSHKDSFPARYGYLNKNPKEGSVEDGDLYHLLPYLLPLKYAHVSDVYDSFGQDSHDTDRDEDLSFLEFCPIGAKSGPNAYTYPTALYRGDNLNGEVSKQMDAQRPLVYIPVRRKQADQVAEFYYKYAQEVNPQQGWYAERWLPNFNFGTGANPIANIRFPPPKYDDFVLIGVGPGGTTGGLLTPPDSFINDVLAVSDDPGYLYHAMAMRAFFLATRDINDNGLLDFQYMSRTRRSEGLTGGSPELGYDPLPYMYNLPDGTPLAGPIIYQASSAGM